MQNRRCAFLAILFMVGLSSRAAVIPEDNIRKAGDFFIKTCSDDRKIPIVLAGLKSTKDVSLLPLFTALTGSENRDIRLIATTSLPAVGEKQSAPLLIELLFNDKSMLVRSEAIIQLRKMDAITALQLVEALSIEDEGVQIIAARGLAKMNRARMATEPLKKLAESKDRRTAIFARTTLLGSGDRKQIGYLRKVILDPKTTDAMIISLLDQIRVEKISTALPLAETLSAEERPLRVRIRAYMVIDDLSPGANRQLLSAIRKSDDLLLTCNLMRLLAQRDDSEEILKQMAKQTNTTGLIASFELSRAKGGGFAETALTKMMAPGHPVLIEYAMDRFQNDIKDSKNDADFYVGPFMKYIRSAKIDSGRMTTVNERVARIIRQFGELGSASALLALKDLLNKQNSITLRELTVGALYRCDQQKVCDLVRPLVNSPFPKLSTYATLLLARHGDTSAAESLVRLQKETLASRIDLLTMTNWYILKFAGQTTAVMKQVAGKLR